jgi:hypothetical protein
MTAVTLSLLAGVGVLSLAPPAPPKDDQPAARAEGSASPSPGPSGGDDKVLPSAKAGDFRVEVLGVGDVTGMKMTTEFDLSRMTVEQSTTSAGKSDTFGKKSGNGQTGGNVSGGGFAGGAGGGTGGVFSKPTFGIAVKVEPVGAKADGFAKLGSKVKAYDDNGQVIESNDLGPTVHHFAAFEGRWPDAQFLYVFRKPGDAAKIVRLEGELLVTPGRKRTVRFDGSKGQTKTVGKDQFKLESVATTAGGVQVKVTFPPLASVEMSRTPQERFQATVLNRGGRSAVIEDSEGDVHPPTGASNTGNGVQGSAGSGNSSTQTFSFPPLPEGRTIKAIRVGLEERAGEPKVVGFTLENIPLK